jgi:hypothetical protein
MRSARDAYQDIHTHWKKATKPFITLVRSIEMTDELWAWAIIVVGAFFWVGWVLNLITLFKVSYDVVTLELVLRIAGVPLSPLGGLMGWF